MSSVALAKEEASAFPLGTLAEQGEGGFKGPMLVQHYIKSFLWVFPFIFFLTGYWVVRYFAHREVLYAPAVLGHHIHDAIRVLSSYSLNVRILAEKEDAHLPEGLIISQSPQEGQKIKRHQSVYLVITRKPPKVQAPNLYGLTSSKAEEIAKDGVIKLKLYSLESDNAADTSFAQNVQPGQELADNSLIAYFSTGKTNMRIFPNLKDKPALEAIEFLKDAGMQVNIFHSNSVEDSHNCSDCIVIDQRPLAGSLIDLKKALTVQLTLSKKSGSLS